LARRSGGGPQSRAWGTKNKWRQDIFLSPFLF